MEGQQLPSPQAGGQLQVEGRQQSSFFRLGKIQADFLLRQNFHFPFFELWQLAALGGINLDFPDVIAVRNELLPAGEREENIPCDLNDTAWLARIDASCGAVFFAAGVFYYFLAEQVQALVRRMADAFPGGVLVFDAANQRAVKLIAKTWLKGAEIKNVGAYFAVSDAVRELSPWDSRLRVTSRGYMLGYHNLKDPSVGGLFRLFARASDGLMKMQIVKIGFGREP